MRHFHKIVFLKKCSHIILFFFFFNLSGCGGSGSNGNGPSGNINPGDFNSTVKALNKAEVDVNEDTLNFAKAYHDFFGTNMDGLSSAQIRALVDNFVSAGNTFVSSVKNYSTLLKTYKSNLSASSDSLVKFQSVGLDTLPLDVAIGVEGAKNGEAECRAKHNPDTAPDEYAACVKAVQAAQLSSMANTGVGAVVSGGAGAVAGLAASAAGAPVLVVAGTVVGVGLAVGLIWSWCTSSSSKLVKSSASGQTCALVSCQDTVQSLPDGRKAAICSVPPGTGTLTIHVPGGTPITQELTIGANGLTIDISGCDTDEDTSSASDAKDCNSNSDSTAGAQAVGTSCSDITTLTINNSPADPGPGVGVTVTAKVFPTVASCTVNFSISGTDGYSNSSSPSTDAAGQATFFIPGGAAGVVDSVSVITNSIERDLGYTF